MTLRIPCSTAIHSLPRLSLLGGAFLVALAASSPTVWGQSKQDSEALAGRTLPMESVRDARFRFLDLNGDGYLVMQEIDEDNTVLRSQFHSLDGNDDGRLSEAEYVLFSPPESQ